MKKQPIQSATSLPPSPDDERRSRMIKYSVMMGIRFVCVIVAFTIPFSGWTLIPLAGALILPYIAVIVANTVVQYAGPRVVRPGSLLRVPSPSDHRSDS